MHVELDDRIYEVMLVNDLNVSPDEYIELTGYEYSYIEYDSYHINHMKFSYVSDNIELMNYMTENEYGVINDEGELEWVEDEYIEQWWLYNWNFRWYKVTFKANDKGSFLLGIIGLLVNWGTFKDFKKLLQSSEDTLTQCLFDVINDVSSEIGTYFSDLAMTVMIDCMSLILTIFDAVSEINIYKKIAKLFVYIISHYVPSLVKGLVMMLGGFLYQYGCDCEVGLWWSGYIKHLE